MVFPADFTSAVFRLDLSRSIMAQHCSIIQHDVQVISVEIAILVSEM